MTKMNVLWFQVLSAVGLAGLVSSCSDPTHGCDPCRTEAIVFGVVTDTTGAPVPDVRVDVLVSARPCTEFVEHGWSTFPPLAKTGPDGRYRALVISPFAPFTAACVTVTGNSNEDPEWPTTQVAIPVSLELRTEGAPHDSVKVDITLRDAAGE